MDSIGKGGGGGALLGPYGSYRYWGGGGSTYWGGGEEIIGVLGGLGNPRDAIGAAES